MTSALPGTAAPEISSTGRGARHRRPQDSPCWAIISTRSWQCWRRSTSWCRARTRSWSQPVLLASAAVPVTRCAIQARGRYLVWHRQRRLGGTTAVAGVLTSVVLTQVLTQVIVPCRPRSASSRRCATVAPSSEFAPHVTSRCRVCFFPEQPNGMDPEWVVVDRPLTRWPIPVAERQRHLTELQHTSYFTVTGTNSVLVLRHR